MPLWMLTECRWKIWSPVHGAAATSTLLPVRLSILRLGWALFCCISVTWVIICKFSSQTCPDVGILQDEVPPNLITQFLGDSVHESSSHLLPTIPQVWAFQIPQVLRTFTILVDCHVIFGTLVIFAPFSRGHQWTLLPFFAWHVLLFTQRGFLSLLDSDAAGRRVSSVYTSFSSQG